MRGPRSFLQAIAAAFLIGSGAASSADACTCIYQNLCTELFYTDFVFAARVIEIGSDPSGLKRVRMAVFAEYKGEVPDTVDVLTGWWDGDCGIPFQLAPEWLVFAGGASGGTYGAFLCSRTQPFDPDDPILSEIIEPCPTPVTPVTWARLKARH